MKSTEVKLSCPKRYTYITFHIALYSLRSVQFGSIVGKAFLGLVMFCVLTPEKLQGSVALSSRRLPSSGPPSVLKLSKGPPFFRMSGSLGSSHSIVGPVTPDTAAAATTFSSEVLMLGYATRPLEATRPKQQGCSQRPFKKRPRLAYSPDSSLGPQDETLTRSPVHREY